MKRLPFWSLVEPTGFCWNWIGHLDRDGYGQYGPRRATRLAYEKLVGHIPVGLQLDHLCRNRACVNPDHLDPVTPQENTARGYGLAGVRGRSSVCKRGHDLSGDNLIIQSSGARRCRTCQNAANRAWKNRRMLSGNKEHAA